MKLFQNLILFTKIYGNLQEMLEMASFLKYVDLYLTSKWGRFHVGHPTQTVTSEKSRMYHNALHYVIFTILQLHSLRNRYSPQLFSLEYNLKDLCTAWNAMPISNKYNNA
jgi:hypothetical protein